MTFRNRPTGYSVILVHNGKPFRVVGPYGSREAANRLRAKYMKTYEKENQSTYYAMTVQTFDPSYRWRYSDDDQDEQMTAITASTTNGLPLALYDDHPYEGGDPQDTCTICGYPQDLHGEEVRREQ